jgi:WD40 repeat protein
MDGWSAPRPLPDGWSEPSLAFDGAGRATAGYAQLVSTSPLATRVAIADLQSADEWVDGFEIVSTPGDIPFSISVAVGDDGTAAACFTSQSSSDNPTAKVRHRVLYRPAGSDAWEDPFDIVATSESANFVRIRNVRVSPNGLAVVLADRYDGPVVDSRIGSIVVSSHAPGGTWTTPVQVNPAGTHAGGASLELDVVGNATIAWVHRWQTAPELNSIRVVTLDAATGVLSQPAILTSESGSATVSNARVVVNASGAAALGTQVGAQANVTTRATQAGSWKQMTALFTDATAASSNPGAIGISPTGTSYVLYWRQGPTVSTNDVIGISRCPAGGTWETPRNLSVTNMNMFDGAIAFRDDDAYPVFTGAIGFAPGAGEQGVGVFQASQWKGGAPQPETPTDLAPQGGRHSLAQAVWDNAGSLVVTETVFSGSTSRIFATTLDRLLAVKFRFTQQGPVNAVAFSPDGAILATAADKTARLFDLATGQKRLEVTHTGTVRAVAFFPDGLSIASASDDATARITTIASGAELARLNHDGPAIALAVSRDGKRLASASTDGTARLLEIGAGIPPRKLRHDGSVNAVAFNHDGSRVATASDDGNARIFNADTGALLLTLAQGGAVKGAVFSPDGTRLATAGADGTARIYNAATGESVLSLTHGGPVHAVAFDKDGTRLGTASADGTSRIITTQTGAVALTLRHGTAVTAVAFSLDGTRIATATSEDIAYVYDKAGVQQARLRHDAPVNVVAFRPDGTQLATACGDKIARVFTFDGA